MNTLPTLSVANVTVRQHDGLYSLNDLHKASGGATKHQPALFLRNEQTKALIAEIENSEDSRSLISSSTDSQSLAIKTVLGKGKQQGTFACRELVIAYAAWISPAFHLKVIRVFLDASQPSATITPAQQQHLKELVDLIAQSGAQTHAETWARLHRKFNIPRYAELPATQFDAACAYLKGKMDEPRLAQKHLPPLPEARVLIPVADDFNLDEAKHHLIKAWSVSMLIGQEILACLHKRPEAKAFLVEIPAGNKNTPTVRALMPAQGDFS